PPASGDARTLGGHASVHGALLLRGAVAAARAEDRELTRELLGAAEASARVVQDLLGSDGNLQWTAFGPVNVALHHVTTSVDLGDAGAALAAAAKIDPGAIGVRERRVTLSIDVARAYAMWGKPGRSVDALLAAERV